MPKDNSTSPKEQGAVLFLNEDAGTWEFVAADIHNPAMSWKSEKDALRDLAKEGWNIEGPFRMSPKSGGFPGISFIGYGLTRLIQ